MIIMLNQVKFINLTFWFLIIGVTLVLSQTRDLINFNVYQTGSRIHGHYKLPANHLKINFQLDEVNSTYYTFNLISGQPNPFDINGDLALIEHNNGIVEYKGQMSSESSETKVTIDTNITTVANGHLIETKVHLNVSNTIVKYSLGLDLLDNCWPFKLRHNITTIPVNLISYKSSVNGYCDAGQRKTNNVTLDAKLGSSQWDWLNSTILQHWTFNATGGSEKMALFSQGLGSGLVYNEWVNEPVPKTVKKASFVSNSTLLPSFRASYLVDGKTKVFTYQPY